MTDDEIFDRIIRGADSGLEAGFDSAVTEAQFKRVLAELQNLRDQFFAISMASVSDGQTKVYENYNNIILDELGAIKDAIVCLTDASKSASKSSEETANDVNERVTAICSEMEQLKEEIAEQKQIQSDIVALLNKIEAKLDAPLDSVATATTSNDTQNVMSEIESIKKTINAMQGNDGSSDEDLESSIARLKAELSQMAGIIEGK